MKQIVEVTPNDMVAAVAGEMDKNQLKKITYFCYCDTVSSATDLIHTALNIKSSVYFFSQVSINYSNDMDWYVVRLGWIKL